MKAILRARVFRSLPDFKLGLVHIRGVDNFAELDESKHLLTEASEMVKLTFSADTAGTHELIAPWKVAQLEFGARARHYHTIVEKLMNKVLRKQSVMHNDVISNLVNFVSLKRLVPIGVDDVDSLAGDVVFDIAQGTEKFGKVRRVKKGALFYRDAKGVIATKMDYNRVSRTMLSKKSTSVLIHIDALGPVGKRDLQKILKEIEDLVNGFCGGTACSIILDSSKREWKV